MAYVYPDHIDPEDPRRAGERLVHQWLSDDSVRGTAYYSQLQKTHRFKLISEVDFLYINERGFLCIEVIGGTIHREDKNWFSDNKRGVTNGISNPFVQAIGCQNALKRYLEETFGKNSTESKFLVGYAVILPECSFKGRADDLTTEVLFDGKKNIDDFSTFLDETFDYWYKQEQIKHGNTPLKLNNDQLKQMNDLFRGDFQCAPSMRLEFQTAQRQMIQLTDEQYDVLDIAEDNSNVVISGVAGTGKSLLAVELAKRAAAKNKNVLYICFNRNMATYARTNTNGNNNITVFTLHKLIMSFLRRDDLYNSSVVELCQLYSSQTADNNQQYDYVVVDEGQDLLCLPFFDVLDSIIIGGISKGQWTIFLDPNQNIFNKSEEYEFAIDYLKDVVKPANYSLKTNCRNTEQIARRTSALTLVPPAKYLKIKGPVVNTKVYSDDREFIKLFREDLMSLLSFGVLAKDIVILSRYKKENSLLKKLDAVCNMSINECDDVSKFNPKCINYFTVQSYKGLESEYVFLIDIDGFESPENRRINYVGMSRAKIRLSIFFCEQLRDEYENTLDAGRELLV